MNEKFTLPMISADSEALADRLLKVEPNTLITYGDLNAVINGRDVRSDARGNLSTARRKLQREESIVFDPIRGVGLKRLTDVDIVKTSGSTMLQINRTSLRGMKKLSCVTDFVKLSTNEQTKHNAAMTLLGVFYQVSKAKSMNKIEVAVGMAQKKLPVSEALRAFMGIQTEQSAV